MIISDRTMFQKSRFSKIWPHIALHSVSGIVIYVQTNGCWWFVLTVYLLLVSVCAVQLKVHITNKQKLVSFPDYSILYTPMQTHFFPPIQFCTSFKCWLLQWWTSRLINQCIIVLGKLLRHWFYYKQLMHSIFCDTHCLPHESMRMS